MLSKNDPRSKILPKPVLKSRGVFVTDTIRLYGNRPVKCNFKSTAAAMHVFRKHVSS